MERSIIDVPRGIRYLSEWSGFCLPDYPHILNKTLTGCGFTEWVITNSQNIILCSPRKILLENKESQHPDVLYVKNEFEKSLGVDKDLNNKRSKANRIDINNTLPDNYLESIKEIKSQIKSYIVSCSSKSVPIKILVTYDSFRIVKDALVEFGIDIDKMFNVYVDEFQSIFVDSSFKPSTEIEFLDQLKNITRVCFVSATPMMDDYLEMLDEFKDLPYFELDWKKEDPLRVMKPFLEVHSCSKSIIQFIGDIIQEYRDGNGESFAYTDASGQIVEIKSKEAVIYVNSVRNICDTIKKFSLTPDECNILCAKTEENEKELRSAFGIRKKRGVVTSFIGSVPLKGEPHKMFTLCTRTVYLGADFYSTNAKSYIFSDANVDSLTVDITLDLPQILGRQRLDENPWKNRATLYYRTLAASKREELDALKENINNKKEATEALLESYNSLDTDKKKYLVLMNYEELNKKSGYSLSYVSINKHSGPVPIPVFNNLVMVSELRNYKIQQIDYKDRFSIFSMIKKDNIISAETKVDEIINLLDTISGFPAKMKKIYELNLSNELYNLIFARLPMEYGNFYRTLTYEQAKAKSFRKGELGKKYDKSFNNQDIDISPLVYQEFKIGEKYTMSWIKEKLGEIYIALGYKGCPKASDIERWFDIKACQILNKETGKRDHGFEILKKKGE